MKNLFEKLKNFFGGTEKNEPTKKLLKYCSTIVISLRIPQRIFSDIIW